MYISFPEAKPLAENARRTERFPMFSKMKVCLPQTGLDPLPMPVRGLNISETGAAFVSGEPLPVAARIYLQLPNSRVSAPAMVRNCSRRGAAWRIGVEVDGEVTRLA